LKIAVVHDWLVTNGGAEKILKAILDIYPDADVFSLVDFLSDEDRKIILNGKYAKSSFIQKLPFAKNSFRNYLPLFPKAIESFDLSKYDLIISSSWAVAKGVKKSSNQLHICYCHTPIRYAWDLYDEYISNLKEPKKTFAKISLHYIREWDIKTVDRVDYFIANSNYVKSRIKRVYNKDSKVIYPPVDTDNFKFCSEKKEYYITASRLVPYKKTKLIVEAFNKMPNRELIVIGDGIEYEDIKKIAKSNVKVLGYKSKDELIKYMQEAKAFVYGAIEDFGIVVVEALSCGTPVIALNRGATLETIEDGVNGILFKEQNINEIITAVEKFETIRFDYNRISKNAQFYSVDRFKKEFSSFVNSKVKKV